MTVLPGYTVAEVATPGGRDVAAATTAARLPGRRDVGARSARRGEPRRHRPTSTACSAPAPTSWCRGRPDRRCWAHDRPLRRRGRLRRAHSAAAARRGMTPYQADHGGVDRAEGGHLTGRSARHRRQRGAGGPGHLQPPGAGHAPADGLHRPLRRGPRRRPGDRRPTRRSTRPYNTYLHTGLTPTPDLLPVGGRRCRPRCIPRRGTGSTSWLTRRTGPRRSPTPSPASWPPSSWPRAGGWRDGPDRRQPTRRSPTVAVGGVVGRRGHRRSRRATRCRRCCTTPPSTPSGLDWVSVAFPSPPAARATPWPGCGPSASPGCR